MDDEIVELSNIQFQHAQQQVEKDINRDISFDYWLYVVEKQNDRKYKVLPVRNPAGASRKFEIREGT